MEIKIINKLLYIAIVLSAIFLYRCSNNIEKVRNNIFFDAPVNAVEDSLKKMNQLMEKLPEEKEEIKNSFLDMENNWIVNNQKLGKLDSVNVHKIRVIRNLTYKEKVSFKNIMIFLRSNFIYGCYKNAPCKNCYLYDYRPTLDNSFKVQRNILIVDGDNLKNLLVTHQLLDKINSIALITGK